MWLSDHSTIRRLSISVYCFRFIDVMIMECDYRTIVPLEGYLCILVQVYRRYDNGMWLSDHSTIRRLSISVYCFRFIDVMIMECDYLTIVPLEGYLSLYIGSGLSRHEKDPLESSKRVGDCLLGSLCCPYVHKCDESRHLYLQCM